MLLEDFLNKYHYCPVCGGKTYVFLHLSFADINAVDTNYLVHYVFQRVAPDIFEPSEFSHPDVLKLYPDQINHVQIDYKKNLLIPSFKSGSILKLDLNIAYASGIGPLVFMIECQDSVKSGWLSPQHRMRVWSNRLTMYDGIEYLCPEFDYIEEESAVIFEHQMGHPAYKAVYYDKNLEPNFRFSLKRNEMTDTRSKYIDVYKAWKFLSFAKKNPCFL